MKLTTTKHSAYNNLKHLLLKNGIKSQSYFAVLGTVLGLVILILTLELFLVIKSNVAKNTSYLTVASKSSTIGSGLSFLGLKQSGISNNFISKLKPYCNQITPYYYAGFKVNAVAEISYNKYYSEFFVESVDDDFLEEIPKNWNWKEGDDTVNIILPLEYLALYNLGFAPSRGLPALSQKIAKSIPFKISLPQLNLSYKVNIAYFGKRINTILAPKSFIKYHNNLVNSSGLPKKLLLNYKSQFYNQIKNIVNKNNYQLIQKNQMQNFAQKAVFVSIGFVSLAIILGLMSFVLFFSYFNNLLVNSKQNIKNLIYLGYSKSQLLKIYYAKLNTYFASLTLISLTIIIIGLILKNKYIALAGFLNTVFIYKQTIVCYFAVLAIMYFMQKIIITKKFLKI